MQGFIVGRPSTWAQLYHGANPDRTGSKLEVQAEALVKNKALRALAEYDDPSSTNIAIVLFRYRPAEPRPFTEPPDQIKKELQFD